MKFDDIILGAGVSGLTTALLLAQHGRRVAVIEKSPSIAPTIRGFVKKGVYFDTGFHYGALLEHGEMLEKLFDRLGILSRIEFCREEGAGGDRLYGPSAGFKFEFGSSIAETVVRLTEAFPEEERSIGDYFDHMRRFLHRLNEERFAAVTDPTILNEYANLSLARYLESAFISPVLKTILSMHAMLYGSRPEETSVKYHTMVTSAYYTKNRRIVGGGGAIVRAFEQQLSDYGISVFAGSAVTNIDLDIQRRVKAVVLDNGEIIECDNCVFSAHPRFLPKMLPEGTLRPAFRGRIEGLNDTMSAIVLFCTSEKTVHASDFTNIILTQQHFPDIFGDGTGASMPPLFISRSVSKEHAGGISVICPWDHDELRSWETSVCGTRDAVYYEWKKNIAEMIITEIRTCVKECLGDLECIDIATPLTFRDYMNAPNGCLYGVKHGIDDMPFLPQTKIQGLFLSGQMLLSCGVMGAMLAGFLSAAAITKENYLLTMK